MINFCGIQKQIGENYAFDVPTIDANVLCQLEILITIPKVSPLLKGSFTVQLLLYYNGSYKCIHEFPFDISTAFCYVPIPNQDVLFIINDKITLVDIAFL